MEGGVAGCDVISPSLSTSPRHGRIGEVKNSPDKVSLSGAHPGIITLGSESGGFCSSVE